MNKSSEAHFFPSRLCIKMQMRSEQMRRKLRKDLRSHTLSKDPGICKLHAETRFLAVIRTKFLIILISRSFTPKWIPLSVAFRRTNLLLLCLLQL